MQRIRKEQFDTTAAALGFVIMQPALGCGNIAMFTEQEFNRESPLIDSTIEVSPSSFDSNVGLSTRHARAHRSRIMMPLLKLGT
jgi:hypothetical protein